MLKEMKVALGATAVMGLFGVAGLVSPSAPAGTTATMEASPSTVAQGGTVEISSVPPCPDYDAAVGGAEGIDGSAFDVVPGEDGHWAADIEIPADQAPGTYIVEAYCERYFLPPAEAGLAAPAQQLPETQPYAPVTITVVAQETTTSTSTTSTTVPTDAAPAVVAAPTYTG